MSNYKDWIDAIEIKVDYFSAFMKAWIAFNAWYESGEISAPGNRDKDYIESIANHTNRFKSYITNLLIADNSEGKTYRDSIANLHGALLSAPITTQAYIGVRQAVSFSEVSIKNPNASKIEDYYSYHYECIRANGKIKTTISVKTTGQARFSFEQDEHNIEVLKAQSDFKALSQTQQEKCLACYAELRPYIVESVLAPESNPQENSFMMGSYSFVNDTNSISRAIVLVLYLLRCCLAHGDISPDESTNRVYRYAYEVLLAPLKKLK